MDKVSATAINFTFLLSSKLGLTFLRRNSSGFYYVPKSFSISQYIKFILILQFLFMTFISGLFIFNLFDKTHSSSLIKQTLIFVNLSVGICFTTLHLAGNYNIELLSDLLNHQIRVTRRTASAVEITEIKFMLKILDGIQTFVALAAICLSALYLILQIGIYIMGICILPFNAIQVVLGSHGTCNRNPFITAASFLVDTICIQSSLASGLFVLSNCMSYGVIFLIKQLCQLQCIMLRRKHTTGIDSLRNMEHHLTRLNGVHILTVILNSCFRRIVNPVLITTASVLFSITSALMVLVYSEIFHSISLFVLPIVAVDSGSCAVIGTTLCSMVFKISTDIKVANVRGSSLYKASKWLRKKQRSLQSTRVYIGDSYFDREMPLVTLDHSFSNAISILLGIRA